MRRNFAAIKQIGVEMGLVTEDVEVSVEGLPHFFHERTSISILPSMLTVTKLSFGPTAPAGQVASTGAHFKFQFPAEIVFQCLERSESLFRFEGPFLGIMDGRANRPAFEDGPSSYAITGFSFLLSVAPAINLLELKISGDLSPMRPAYDYWTAPLSSSSFRIRAPVPLNEVATLFSGDRAVVQSRIDKALARLNDLKD
jgi:hypothetical protein